MVDLNCKSAGALTKPAARSQASLSSRADTSGSNLIMKASDASVAASLRILTNCSTEPTPGPLGAYQILPRKGILRTKYCAATPPSGSRYPNCRGCQPQ